MIDTQHVPQWWLIDGEAVTAAQAEARFGAALYRDPRPVGRDGKQVQPLPSPDAGETIATSRQARWDVV